MKKLLLTFLIAFITALGLNAKDYYTIQFNSSYDDPSVTSYTDSWTATRNGKKWNLANFNNNNYQDYWAYIKCGRKKSASVATFSSDAALPEKISTVTVTIDKITVESVNSISLTVADDAQFETNAATYTAATLAKGDLPFTIDKPAANKYYKLTFDCKKSSNGVIQVSKFVFSGNDDLPTSCEAPNFNFEENAEVTTGDVIKATCKTENSTVYLKVGNADFEQTDSYTITKERATGPLSFEAYATVQGANGIIKSDHTSLNVNVVKKLGDIRYNGEDVPATISLKGGETLTFTSANAVSMTLVVNGANKITTLDTGEISWTAPAATEAADQTYALSITSKLDDAVKTANTTVTVAKKPTVETFELLTDLNDVNEENTYILYGVTTAYNGVMSKNLNSKDAFDGLSTYTLTDGVITIPADATDVAIITLESDNSGNEVKYYLKTQDNKYIQTTDKASSLKDTKSEATPFSISVRDAEKHTISIYGGGAYFSYNGTNVNRFRGYGSHQSPTYLYVKRAAQVAPEAPTFTPDGGDVDLFSTVKIACATEGATLTYKIGDGEATAYPADGIKMTKAGEVTITAIATKGRLSTETTKTFNVIDKGLVDGLIEYPVSEFVYTIGSGEQLPVLDKYPDNVDVEYSISHERVENGVAVYNPATIDEQGNITVNTPGIVTVTATVKADRSKTASYVLEIQSLREAEIAGTGSATPTGNVYTKVVNDDDPDLYENGHLYAILSYHDGKVYAMTPEDAGSNEGLKAVVIKEGVTGFEEEYTIDNSAVANMLFDFSTLCLTYNDNGTLKYLVSPSVRHMQLTAETPTESHSFEYSTSNDPYRASLKIDRCPIYCNPDQLYFNTFDDSNSQLGTYLFNCFLYKVGAQITSASTVKAPVVHITGGNVYYSPDGEWYWGTEDENNELSFANETAEAQIYYTMTSATPSSANVRAMANSATGTLYSTPFKKRDLDGKKITFWAEKDGQKSAVETLNFNIKTGIEDIDVENAEAIEEEGDARYFNLQGLEVKNPGEGIYIRVANGKATKILKK